MLLHRLWHPWWQLAWKCNSLTRLAAQLLCLTICAAALPSPTQPNPAQPSSFSHSSFSCPDIFIVLLKLLRAHYLRGRNVGLIVWWLQRLDPFFSLCNQPTLAGCLMFSSQCQAKRGLSRCRQLSTDREPSFHWPKHSEQTINHWHAFQYFSPIVSVSSLHGAQV